MVECAPIHPLASIHAHTRTHTQWITTAPRDLNKKMNNTHLEQWSSGFSPPPELHRNVVQYTSTIDSFTLHVFLFIRTPWGDVTPASPRAIWCVAKNVSCWASVKCSIHAVRKAGVLTIPFCRRDTPWLNITFFCSLLLSPSPNLCDQYPICGFLGPASSPCFGGSSAPCCINKSHLLPVSSCSRNIGSRNGGVLYFTAVSSMCAQWLPLLRNLMSRTPCFVWTVLKVSVCYESTRLHTG